MSFPYVTDVADLRASVAAYAEQMEHLDTFPREVAEDAVKLLPRYNVWVALLGDDDKFIVAPSKFAGHKSLDLASYKKHRSEPEGSPERLNGTEAERRISNLGGRDFEIGKSDHPATQAVREFCNRLGKSAKSTARVRVFEFLEVPDVQNESSSEAKQLTPEVETLLRGGLTIPQAKQALAIKFGCKPSNIEIIIRA